MCAYQNPTVWIDPTGHCPQGQIGVITQTSASCRDMTWGERHPILSSFADSAALVNRDSNGNAVNPIDGRILNAKEEFNAKFGLTQSVLPASRAPALAGPTTKFLGKQADKVKELASPALQKAKSFVDPALQKVRGATDGIAGKIGGSKLNPSNWEIFNAEDRFDQFVAEQARHSARSNAGGANLVEESVDQVQSTPYPTGTFSDLNRSLRNSNGTFATDSSTLKTKLNRPSLRADTKRQIESNAPKNTQGQFIDESGEVINDSHFGHITGHENRRILAAGDELGLTQPQINDYVNARPQFFKIEDAKRNLRHTDELIDMEDFFDE